MIKNIKSIFKTSVLLLAGSFILWNCESEADNLGSQFFDGASAEGVNKAYDVIAYNISNNDTIQSDASKLNYATLGAFAESQFGLQKSSYVTQARLNSYDPDFGTNPVIDSVVLEMKPLYPVDTVTTTTDDKFIYENIEAKKVTNTYPITRYGKRNLDLTVNVHEVTDFLGSTSDKIYSDKVVNYGTLLGSKKIAKTITSTKITKRSDNTELLSLDAKIRIPLEAGKTFFQNKIFAKKGQPELSDVSNFIRYFKGVRISVAENDGYIFKFTPNDTQIQIYYKSDVTTNGTTKATPAVFSISLGSGNVHFNQINFDRTNTPADAIVKNLTPNYTSGDEKLYAQGSGGPSIGLRIPAATVAEIRNLYKNSKIGILSAKVRLYTDKSVWDNKYEKPSDFTAAYYDPTKPLAQRMDLNTFLKEYAALSANGAFKLVKAELTKDPAYYDITLTQTFKDIIEKSEEPKDIALSVGSYDINLNTGMPIGQYYTSRVYTPNRIVLVGTNATNANRAQLHIIYATK